MALLKVGRLTEGDKHTEGIFENSNGKLAQTYLVLKEATIIAGARSLRT